LPPREPKQPRERPVDPLTLLASEPKPLKVIRRRATEGQKVFQTAPKLIPRAMLEGIKPVTDDDAGDSEESS
jgi:hypothetical protein